MGWFGLGKPRSKFGKWCDKNRIDQVKIEKKSSLSRGTVSRMCNDKDYSPKFSTFYKLQKGLSKMGYEVEYEDFW